jgi:hypothetical protein
MTFDTRKLKLLLVALHDATKYEEDYGACWGEKTRERKSALKMAKKYQKLRAEICWWFAQGKAIRKSQDRSKA